MHPGILILGYVALTLLPLALAVAGARPPRGVMDELASGAGMLAFAIILVEFVLSGRFRPISGRIGMDVTMRAHQLLARSALVLALVHPFLYRAPRNPPLPWDPTRQLTVTPDFAALWSGVAAWLLLFVLVVFAIARDALDQRYEGWRLAHGVGAIAIAGLTLHHTLVAGRYAADPALAAVWSAMFALAALTLAHVYLVRPLMQLGRPWRVVSVQPAALRSWAVTIEPLGHAGLDYRAGQFVWLNLGQSPFSLAENPFSISSAPAAGPRLEFLIKELGDATGRVGQVAPGTRAHLDGPHGTLVVAERSAPGVGLVAGGIGLAPLLGILRQLRLEGDRRPTALVYGNRLADQIIARDELEAIAAAQGTEIVHVVSEPPPGWTGRTGMIDAALIRDVFGAPERRDWLYVLCGPPAMLQAAEDELIRLGVAPGRILSERFSYD